MLQNVARNIISSMHVGKIIETERPFRATAKLAAFYLPARPNLGDQSIPPLAYHRNASIGGAHEEEMLLLTA